VNKLKTGLWIILFIGLLFVHAQEQEQADLVVLSKDLFSIPPLEILRTEVLYAILGGKIVYQNQ
jgi:hypothetical protein